MPGQGSPKMELLTGTVQRPRPPHLHTQGGQIHKVILDYINTCCGQLSGHGDWAGSGTMVDIICSSEVLQISCPFANATRGYSVHFGG